ncbi:hypothetical protein GGI12_003652 [Dipsacomyces acuminosporus]|nr:hypothetical protein GGI12_003652 [Dipsacomyces acuminosporus]
MNDELGLTGAELEAAKKLPPIIKWRTNLGRIAKEGVTDKVENLAIGSYYRYLTPEDIIKTLKGFGFDKLDWSGVRELHMKFGYYHDDTFEETEEIGWKLDESSSVLGDFLAERLPNITAVVSEESQRHRTAPRNSLSGFLSKRIDRLQKLKMEFTCLPDFGVKSLPGQLTYLDLEVYSVFDYVDIPRIMAPSLVFLKLRSIPLYYLWDRFYDGNGSNAKNIEFKQLETLKLTFHHPSRTVPAGKSEDDFAREKIYKERGIDSPDKCYNGNPKLKTISVKEKAPKYTVLKSDRRHPLFPKLRVLHLALYPGRVCEFLKDIPQRQIADLSISGDLVIFKGLHLGGFASLRNCDLAQYTETKIGGLPHKKRLLARAFAQSPTLRTLNFVSESSRLLKLPPMDEITCTGLRKLTITGPISFNEIPDLLRRLKYLEYFKFERIKYDTTIDGSDSGSFDTLYGLFNDDFTIKVMKPISTSLITLVPDIISMVVPDDILVYNLISLIAHIPSLRNFKVFDYFASTFTQVIEPMLANPRIRPYIEHLANLNYDRDIWS